jgi:NAD(P)-dependent dehydrogenase (short-subunit alcohol dehydrogenase family)
LVRVLVIGGTGFVGSSAVERLVGMGDEVTVFHRRHTGADLLSELGEPSSLEPVPLTEDPLLRERLYPYRGETPRHPDDPMRWADDYEKTTRIPSSSWRRTSSTTRRTTGGRLTTYRRRPTSRRRCRICTA